MPTILLADGDGIPYSVYVDLAEVWMESEQWERVAIKGEWGGLDLEDPAKRLEVIVALRGLGYSVEGGGPA